MTVIAPTSLVLAWIKQQLQGRWDNSHWNPWGWKITSRLEKNTRFGWTYFVMLRKYIKFIILKTVTCIYRNTPFHFCSLFWGLVIFLLFCCHHLFGNGMEWNGITPHQNHTNPIVGLVPHFRQWKSSSRGWSPGSGMGRLMLRKGQSAALPNLIALIFSPFEKITTGRKTNDGIFAWSVRFPQTPNNGTPWAHTIPIRIPDGYGNGMGPAYHFGGPLSLWVPENPIGVSRYPDRSWLIVALCSHSVWEDESSRNKSK